MEIDLKFSSEQALKRSIRQKYPNAGQAQWKATFLDLKKYVKDSRTVEERLEDQWQEYKKQNNM